ncbi:hypothetical protein PUR61_11200 [Streptomyces sp. BE20]|uniref:hypothetical protein n=1 Tax=Streptomyces sp. BE20 TaxID=3002525 RepID=UPI002E77ED61|nr:hypothetical protein [Streptomyces sp. BE20]MEE1822756.1 hypothetical protein [Streptomyces sp. BE20]
MQFDSAVRHGKHAHQSRPSTSRPSTWLTALALASVAVAGCSSSGDSASDAAKAPSETAAGTSAAGTAAPGTSPGGATPPAGTAPSGGGRAAPPANRPADPCTLLTSDQVVAVVGTPGPFNGMPLGRGLDGSAVWGCGWSNWDSLTSLQEVDSSTFASHKRDSQRPDAKEPAVKDVGDEVFVASRGNAGKPALFFALGPHFYRVEVQSNRKLGANNPDAAKDAAAEESLARQFAKTLKG